MADVRGKPPELLDLTPAQIAPLEARIASFPAVWQDFARSHYLTLVSMRAVPLGAEGCAEAATLAAELAKGVARDLGGTQPYIPVGTLFVAGEKALRVVQAWRSGKPFAAIATAEGITDRRARQLVAAWQKEVFSRSQMPLVLD